MNRNNLGGKRVGRHVYRLGPGVEIGAMACKGVAFAIGVGLCAMAVSASARQVAQAGAGSPQDLSAQKEVEEVVVTGTRLTEGDLTSRVDVIDVEEILARGLTTAEDVIRSIPQNVSTVNGATTLSGDFDSAFDVNLGALAIGTSTANLRGFGSANTLVLVNGRRLSGVAGQEDFFTNLRGIPAAAIERVEIAFDGGSPIYGSDAIAGVINIILKEGYRGASFSARQEFSSTGGDQNRFSGYFGHDWASGSFSVAASLTTSDSVDSSKAGYTTRDLRCTHGLPCTGASDAWLYDFRGLPNRTPSGPFDSGVVSHAPAGGGFFRYPPGVEFVSSPYTFTQILDDQSRAANATPDDFRTATLDDVIPYVYSASATSSEDLATTLSLEQELGERFKVQGELLWAESSSAGTTGRLSGGYYFVPISNAFNNFHGTYGDCTLNRTTYAYENCVEGVYVNYFPVTEIESGLMDEPYQDNTTEQVRWMAGFEWDITDRIDVTVNYLNSESTSKPFAYNFGTYRLEDFPEVVAALSSSDPSTAVNLFGDGTSQNPVIADLLVPVGNADHLSYNTSFEFYASGTLWDGPRAPAFSIGGELREEGLEDLEDEDGDWFGTGQAKPSRDLTAWFGELAFPIVGPDNARPGLQSLDVTLQVRYDVYTVTGAIGLEEAVDGGEYLLEGTPLLTSREYSNVSERIGVRWAPTDRLTVRASASEAFRAPTFTDLFSTRTSTYCSYAGGRPSSVFDPLNGGFVPACISGGSNVDLKPETSAQLALGLDYTPSWAEGLRIRLDYAEIDFTDRIASPYNLSTLLPPEVYGNIDSIFIRDAEGNITEMVSTPINIAQRLSETIDLDVSHVVETPWGTLLPSLNVHYVLQQFDKAFEDSPDKVDYTGYAIGLDRYKIEGRLSWVLDNITADLRIAHTPSYINNSFANNVYRPIPNMDVDSYTTVDVSGTYEWTNGLHLRAGARNLFDTDFPFMIGTTGRPFDDRRMDLRKRVVFAELTYNLDGI